MFRETGRMGKPQLTDWHLTVGDTASPELVDQISRSSGLIEFHISKLVLGHVTHTTELHEGPSPTLLYFNMILQIALTRNFKRNR